MKGYKAFEQDMTCRGFQYEVGETYRTGRKISLCAKGFHFCKRASEPFFYYSLGSRLFEVEARGEIIDGGDKCVCSEIEVLTEVTGRRKTLAMYGYGRGNGRGYGYGNGSGTVNGSGKGDGYYCGLGYGDGYGYGYNYGSGFGYRKGDGYHYFYGRSEATDHRNIERILIVKEG